MFLVSSLSKERIIPELAAATRDEVLEAFARAVHASIPQLEAAVVLRVLQERESIGSTAVGNGVAIPHGKLHGLTDCIVAFGRSAGGVDFFALDGRPCHLFFMVLAPEGAAGKHLAALGHIARLAKDEDFRACLLQAGRNDELWKLLASA